MSAMTSRERYLRMFNHQEADRIPVIESPWAATTERWRREGLPENVTPAEYLDMDNVCEIRVDNSPQFPVKIIEETDEYRIHTTSWGVTMKNWKHSAGTPEYFDFTIVDGDSWGKAKKRITVAPERCHFDKLKQNYKTWKEQGRLIVAVFLFGFDFTHARVCGTERILMAMIEDPDWVRDIFKTQLETSMALMDMVWNEGYEFDALYWFDDMGYKHNQFFSVDTYREMLKPFHKQAIEWAHAKGAKTRLHSCGDVNPFVPELIEIGLDCLNPLEVKAGMDPIQLKKTYGDKLLLHGGLNALLYNEPEKFRAEMERVIPVMKENGGYIFSCDHTVPSSVSFQDFKEIIELAKKLGKY